MASSRAAAGLILLFGQVLWIQTVNAGASPTSPAMTIGPADASRFHCGPRLCSAATEYCEAIQTDVPSIPSVYQCQVLPVSCLPDMLGHLPPKECFPARTRCRFVVRSEREGVTHFLRVCLGGGAGNWHNPVSRPSK